jgi:hypothetical protein
MAVWNYFAAQSLPRAFRGKVMTKAPRTRPVEDQQPLTLLRRLIIEIEDSIAQSREVILSTRDAIELLERLQGRQFSN